MALYLYSIVKMMEVQGLEFENQIFSVLWLTYLYIFNCYKITILAELLSYLTWQVAQWVSIWSLRLLFSRNVLLSLLSIPFSYLLLSVSCWRSARKSWIWTWLHDEYSWQTALKPSNPKTYPVKPMFMFQRESPF